MKVAYEAVNAFGGSGIDRYTRTLGRELARLRVDDTFQVLATRRRTRQYKEFFGGLNNVELDESLWRPRALGGELGWLIERYNGLVISRNMSAVDLTHLTGDVRPIAVRGPFVQTIHDLFPLDEAIIPDSRHSRAFERIMVKRLHQASAILTPSQYTADEIRKQFPTVSAPITVTLLASDDTFKPVQLSSANRELLGLGARPYLIHVGRVDMRKNVERMVEAYRRLPKHLKDNVQLLLVGAAGGSHYYEEIFANDIAAHQIKIISTVTQEQLIQLLSSAVALLFVSLAEGFGLPVIEAMQCGCPVVTSTSTSLPEVAGDAALLVNPLDVDEISHAMQKVIDDETLRDELRARGLKQAESFSWTETARRTSKVYDEVAGRYGALKR